jgi:LysM repeat protein
VTAAPTQAGAAIDLSWLGARAKTVAKALAGPVGAVAAVTIVAALLWHATGVVVEMWLRPKPEPSLAPSRLQTAPAPTSLPATLRAAAPTLAPTVVTVIQVAPTQTAAAPPTPQPTVSAPPSPTLAPTLAPTVAPTVVPSAVPTMGPRPAATEERVHTVERGDTLFSIARRNGTTVGALVSANGLPSPDAVLPVGRRLVIP